MRASDILDISLPSSPPQTGNKSLIESEARMVAGKPQRSSAHLLLK